MNKIGRGCEYHVKEETVNGIEQKRLDDKQLGIYCKELSVFKDPYSIMRKKHPNLGPLFSVTSESGLKKSKFIPPNNLCECKSALGDDFEYDPSLNKGGKKRKTKKGKKKTRKSKKIKKKTKKVKRKVRKTRKSRK